MRNTAKWHLEQASQTDDVALGHKLLEGFIHLSQQNMDGFSLEKLIAWGENHPKYEHWLNEKSSAINERRQRKERQEREETTRQFEENQKQVEFKKQLAIELIHEKVHIHTGSASLATMLKLVSMWGDAFGKTPTEKFDHYFGEDAEEMLIAAEAGFFAFLEREDIPSIAEIIKDGKMEREYKIRIPCFIGMELYYSRNSVATLSDETLLKMFAFWFASQNRAYWKPKWVEWLHSQRPQLIELYLDAELSLPLDGQNIAHLLTLHEYPSLKSKLIELAKRKAQLTEVTRPWQDIPWLVCATCFFSEQKEVLLWEHLDKQPKHFRVVHDFLNRFSNDDLFSLFEANSFSASNFSQLIVRYFELAPSDVDAATDDETRNFFFQTRQFISYLAALGTDQAAQEIERLLIQSNLKPLKYQLQDALHQLKLTQRERAFAFLPPTKVARILANQVPTNSADLAALALAYLDDIANRIRHENDDYFRHFWTTDKTANKTTDKKHRDENTCRDLLLTRLREAFKSLNVDCQPEADYANDKRADIRLSYQNQFEVPIEVKGEWYPQLWKAAQSQLVRQYSIAPNANGYGIYLVLWFGGKGMPNVTDGGQKPASPEELKTRLEVQLNREERERIFIRVLDVTYPN